jgi:hypothetical protein
MPVQIDTDVFAAWREAVADDPHETSLVLFLRGDAEVSTVNSALREVAAEAEGRDPEAFVGEWHCSRAPEGVVLRVEEPDDFEASVRALRAVLDRRGVNGVIAVYDQPPAPDLPRVQRFLECRMRVRGKLKPNAGGLLLWNPNESARRTATEAAVDWCTDHGRRREAVLRVGLTPERLIMPGEDPVDRLSEGEFQGTRSLWTASDGYLRLLDVHGLDGRITLLASIGVDWGGAYESLLEAMMAAAPALAYAFIKAGTEMAIAMSGYSLVYDAPVRPGLDRRALRKAEKVEDRFAPDVFCAQLFGPGYAGRLPTAPGWTRHDAGADAVVLAHDSPQAWLEGQPDDAMLARARADLEPILFDPNQSSP